ncbi:sensor histidine kinase [Microbacterium radiodurans]|nr:histidine kinase [Microbacterium radiodurans]
MLPAAADAAIVTVCLLEALTVLYWADSSQTAVTFAAVVGIAVRRRLPWISVLLALPSVVLGLMTITPLVALYSLAVLERRRWLLITAGSVWLIALVQPWWGFDVELSFSALRLATGVMFTAAPIALGLLVRTRADLSMKLRDLAAARQNERQLIYTEMLMEERARIAREMHDVVSHQVSLIAVQAGALQMRSRDDTATRAADTIRSLAVQTLEELRQMVTVLKGSLHRVDGVTTDDEQPLVPQPSVADIRELVETSHPGATVNVDVPSLPAVYERTLFRAVQEGLTNARKHAPGADVSVVLTTRAGRIIVIVENGRAVDEPMALPGSGHGLIGLRERAKLLGGEAHVDSGPAGFRLTMDLPAPPAASREV